MTKHPLALYTHCGAHRTSLISYSLDNNINIRKALRVVNDLGLLYEQTIKFRNLHNTNNNKAMTLTPISYWQYAQQVGLRKSCIKITLDQYSDIIDALKDYKELDYITNDQKYIANLLLKNMNKSNILLMNISSVIFERLDLLTY